MSKSADPKTLKSRFAKAARQADEELAGLKKRQEEIEERLGGLIPFLRLARQASEGRLAEQAIRGMKIDPGGKCSCGSERVMVTGYEDVGVIFDAKIAPVRYNICFTCRSAARIG
jgi:hypothetical protein